MTDKADSPEHNPPSGGVLAVAASIDQLVRTGHNRPLPNYANGISADRSDELVACIRAHRRRG